MNNLFEVNLHQLAPNNAAKHSIDFLNCTLCEVKYFSRRTMVTIRIKTAVPTIPAITAALGSACLGSTVAGTENMAIQVSAEAVN